MGKKYKSQIQQAVETYVKEDDPAVLKTASIMRIKPDMLAEGLGISKSQAKRWLNREEKIPLEWVFMLTAYLDRAIDMMFPEVRNRKNSLETRWFISQMLIRAQMWLYDVRDELNAEYSREEIEKAFMKIQQNVRFWALFSQNRGAPSSSPDIKRFPMSVN